MTQAEMLLYVVSTYAPDAVLPTEDITYLAHKYFPEVFGMLGYRLYPDHKAVSSVFFRDRGPLKRRWFKRVAPNKYKVTAEGINHAAGLVR